MSSGSSLAERAVDPDQIDEHHGQLAPFGLRAPGRASSSVPALRRRKASDGEGGDRFKSIARAERDPELL